MGGWVSLVLGNLAQRAYSPPGGGSGWVGGWVGQLGWVSLGGWVAWPVLRQPQNDPPPPQSLSKGLVPSLKDRPVPFCRCRWYRASGSSCRCAASVRLPFAPAGPAPVGAALPLRRAVEHCAGRGPQGRDAGPQLRDPAAAVDSRCVGHGGIGAGDCQRPHPLGPSEDVEGRHRPPLRLQQTDRVMSGRGGACEGCT